MTDRGSGLGAGPSSGAPRDLPRRPSGRKDLSVRTSTEVFAAASGAANSCLFSNRKINVKTQMLRTFS